MKQLVIMNFLMLIFVTVSQDTVKQGLDLISADYEKKALKVVCKSIVERQALIYADIKQAVLQTCVSTSKSDYSYFLKKAGKSPEEIRELMEPGNKFGEEIKEYCEGGIQEDVVNKKGRSLLIDVYEHYDCARFSDE